MYCKIMSTVKQFIFQDKKKSMYEKYLKYIDIYILHRECSIYTSTGKPSKGRIIRNIRVIQVSGNINLKLGMSHCTPSLGPK